MSDTAGIDLPHLEQQVARLVADAEEGPGLSDLTRAFIALGIAMSVPVLNPPAARAAMEDILTMGGTHAQIHEIVVLVSGLGVHSLFEGSRMAAELAARDGALNPEAPLDDERLALRDRYVGSRSYWNRFDAVVPGFLDALLRLSPACYQEFFEYCALPLVDATVPNLDKELIAIATDATPAHRYLPTLRLHVENALHLGAGRRSIIETIELAADAPPHQGVA
jgi:alkylhydroperoxidase/carboxymuconolactone decarboxylase family protein YurZ